MPDDRWANHWAEMTDAEVIASMSNHEGVEPLGRWVGSAEMTRRLVAALDRHRHESAASGRRIEKLTRWLVVLTVVLVVQTGVVVWLTASL